VTAEWAEQKTVRLSRRLTVDLTLGLAGMTCEWSPAMPARLTKKELQAYRRARNELAAIVAARLGGSVLIVEV
jgi:hypothetical protein